jgi:CubicO group peptidase (beta-lactamase class C family)
VAQQPEAGPAQDASLSKETRAAPAIHPALPEFRIAACGRLGRVDELFESTRAKLRHCVALGQATGRAPSLTGAVARDGQVLWCAGRGSIDGAEPTADTQYRIGSLTKTFTAVLIMQLRDGGRLDLADRAARYLPDLPLGEITLAQLLSHTAAVASETPPPWWERVSGDVRPNLADVLGEDSITDAPGRNFHYSNPGFALLGGIASALHGRPWYDLVRSEILDPAGMSRTTPMPEAPHALGWAVHPWADVVLPEPTPDTGHMAPAGQLWSTANDLARFAAVLLGEVPDVLAKDTAEEMRVPTSPPTDDAWHGAWGLGLQLAHVNEVPLFGHSGSMPGFISGFWVQPDERLAGIAFANATSGPEITTIAADLIAIVTKEQPRLPDTWTPLAEHDRSLLELAGPWYWGASPVAVRLGADSELRVSALGSRAREARFRRQDDGTWRGLEGYYLNEVLRAVRAADGSVDHLDIGSFVFTREPYPPLDAVPGGVDPAGWR